MTRVTSDETIEKIYHLMLSSPTKSDRDIAKIVKINNKTVSAYRKKIMIRIDDHLASNVAGKFLLHFQMAMDYFKIQIERLDKLKEQTKTVVHSKKDGGSWTTDEKLSPMEILELEKHQTRLWENIITLCSQGEVIEVMKLMQNGTIQSPQAKSS